jgi:pimeloyl-ACP methyl ester carboxylesterase
VSARTAEPLQLAYSDPRQSGAALLLVHGFSHNRSVWEKLARELPDGIRPVSVDLRGHGDSPWSREAVYDPSSYAADLPAVLDDLEIDRAYVAGHSLGGNASVLFASKWPERVTGLILVDASPSLQSSGSAAVADEVGHRLRSYVSIAAYRDELALTHPLGDPEILDRLAATGVVERIDGRYEPALDPGVLGGAGPSPDLAALERELWTALGEVSCPALVVRGGMSAVLTGKVAEEMVGRVLGNGQLVTLPMAGHAVMIDDGPGLAAAIRAFVPSSTRPTWSA